MAYLQEEKMGLKRAMEEVERKYQVKVRAMEKETFEGAEFVQIEKEQAK